LVQQSLPAISDLSGGPGPLHQVTINQLITLSSADQVTNQQLIYLLSADKVTDKQVIYFDIS
jgi:hypothetical protein